MDYRFVLAVVFVLVVVYSISLIKHNYPEEYLIEDFDFQKQPDQITCGPTSAAMVLKYYGHDVSVDSVKDASKTEWFKYDGQSIGMTAPEYIASALRKYGVPAKQKTSTINQLKYFVSQDRPPIVLLRSGFYLWHYVVLIGYTADSFIIADPNDGKQIIISSEDFLGAWRFELDMNGQKMAKNCFMCKGTGKALNLPAPLGTCPMCDGTGKWDDVLPFLLATCEVKKQTIIVPKKGNKRR